MLSHNIITPILLLAAVSSLTAESVEVELPVLDPLPGLETEVQDASKAETRKVARAPLSFTKGEPGKIPGDFSPDWIKEQGNVIGSGKEQGITLEELYVRALRHSKQISVFSHLPLIRETGIQEAKGAFDTNSFLKAMFDHQNEPVGSELTTGGTGRFKQDEWTFEGGLKKRIITGAEISLTQKVGRTENNSTYFTPNPQSTALLELSVSQPLLKGAGVTYNKTIIQIARLDSDIAMSEFIRQSESHLLEIARTYWSLYAARVTYLQKAKLVDETVKVTEELKSRQKIDASQTQFFRAESTLATRRSDLIRAESAIRNAQDRLKSLISDPELLNGADIQLVPQDRLLLGARAIDTQAAAQSAIKYRPEIRQVFLQLRAATLREEMSKNELLPELNLVLSGTLGGLDADEINSAYGKQYNTGAPGFGGGIVFSYPLENNIARARHERRQLERRQQVDQLKTTMDTVLLEVKVSAREVATAYREAQAKYQAVEAFSKDLQSLTERRSLATTSPAPGTDESQATSLYLDQLIDAQDRRAQAEEEFIRAAANYQISFVNLERSKGRLLAYEDVRIVRTSGGKKLPTLHLEKGSDGKAVVSDGKTHR